MGELNNRTVDQLYDSIYKREAANAAGVKAQADMITAKSGVAADDALANLRRVQARVAEIETLLKLDLHPDEKAKLKAEKNKLVADAVQSYASANNSNASAGKTRQETDLEAQRQALLKGLPDGTTMEGLPLAAQLLLLGGQSQDYLTGRESAARQQGTDAYKALANVGTDKQSAADVDEWNSKAPDGSTFGVIYDVDKGWFTDTGAPKQIVLPKGWTMKDVRENARKANITPHELLKKIYEKYDEFGNLRD